MLITDPEYDKMIENFDFSTLPEIVGEFRVNFIKGDPMLPFQQRVIDEKKELDLKLSKLVDFQGNRIFKGLTKEDKKLLKAQATVMKKYSDILEKRIAHYDETIKDEVVND